MSGVVHRDGSLSDVTPVMEFELQTTDFPRCGRMLLQRREIKQDFVFPGCMLSTNAGSVPHLTAETYSYIPKKLHPSLINVPVSSVIDHEDAISAYSGSMSELFNLAPRSMTVISTKDLLPRMRVKSNPSLNTAKAISVWGNNGRIMVTPDRHVNLMSALKPDIFEILADGDTVMGNVSKKRVSKSFSNSLKFLEESLELLEHNIGLENSYVIVVMEGGGNVNLREEYTKKALVVLEGKFLDKTIAFSVDGIYCEDSAAELAKASVAHLPENKLRLMSGPQSPQRIFELLEIGVDMFDTSYPIILAQRNFAITFHIPSSKSTTPNQSKPDVLDIRDDSNRLMFEPLLEGCECYTCQNHTKAYIYHLISVKELLAPILLTLHNLQHYLTFFQALRVSIVEGQYEKFKSEMLDRTIFSFTSGKDCNDAT